MKEIERSDTVWQSKLMVHVDTHLINRLSKEKGQFGKDSYHDNEGFVIVQGKVPLRVTRRFAQALNLLRRGGGGRDVISMPSELEVPRGPDQEIEELHYQTLLVAGEYVLNRIDYDVGKV